MMFSLDLARELAVRSSSTKRRRFWLRPELSQPAAAVLRQVFIGPIGVCCCTWGHLTKGEIKYAKPREWSQRSSRLFLPAELADEGVEGRREKEPEASHANHTE